MIQRFLKHLTFEKRHSPHTVDAYSRDLNQFRQFVLKEFELELSHVDSDHIRAWIVKLVEARLSPKSVIRKIATLRSFYKFFLKLELISHDPTAPIKSLRIEKKLPSFLKEKEMNRLLDHLKFTSDFSGKRDQLLLEMFYATGMRLSELINLKVSDVDVYDSTVKVLGKGNKERILPVPKSLLSLVKDYLTERDTMGFSSKYLILTDKGKPVYAMYIWRKVVSYLGAVTSLRKKSPHVLRHTFATHLLDRGADLKAVRDLLGHASLATTQVYTHNSMEKLKAAFDQAHPKA